MTILTDRFDDALVFASRLHRNQIRKGSNIPYISHLLSVASLVIEHGGDENQAIGALLHDAAEDQGGRAILADITTRFGRDVSDIVSDCTDSWVEPKPAWRFRKEQYLALLPEKSTRSLLVSLADKTHNARSILIDRHAVDEAVWDRFTAGKSGTLWYYTALAEIYRKTIGGPLSDELTRCVNKMNSDTA